MTKDRTGSERTRKVPLRCPKCKKTFDLLVGNAIEVTMGNHGYCETCDDPYAQIKIACPHCSFVLLEKES